MKSLNTSGNGERAVLPRSSVETLMELPFCEAPRFRFVRSSRSLDRIVALAGCLLVACATSAASCAVAGKRLCVFDKELFAEALSLSLTALAGWLGAVACAWGLLFVKRWSLCVCDEAFGWSVGEASTVVRCCDIARINIVSPSESADHLTLVLNSGERISVPSLCIGDLPHLCEVLHTCLPHIVVTYNRAGRAAKGQA
jgi:hypothetical protein